MGTFTPHPVLGLLSHNPYKIRHEKYIFLERRGNFDNITLIGMTDTWENFIVLPKEWRKIAKISTIIKDTHEVHGET